MNLLFLVALYSIFIVLLQTHISGDESRSGQYRKRSNEFYAASIDYRCPSIPCETTILQDAYFHVIIGTNHPSAFPLMVFKICEVVQKCMQVDKMVIVLHSNASMARSQHVQDPQSVQKAADSGVIIKPAMRKKLKEAAALNSGGGGDIPEDTGVGGGVDRSKPIYQFTSFLNEISVPFVEWIDDSFTANSKMLTSFRLLEELNVLSNSQLVYQLDIDEFPQREQFNAALSELASGECDAVMAEWRDRLHNDGSLIMPAIPTEEGRRNAAAAAAATDRLGHTTTGAAQQSPKLNNHLELHQQFPLRCRMSDKFVGGGKTTKTIVYRANYRLDGGHHEVWCDRAVTNLTRVIFDYRTNETIVRHAAPSEERRLACIDHIRERNKGPLGRAILKALPKQAARPRYCPTVVTLDHYKFTAGLLDYLQERYETYRTKGLHWWRDSYKFIGHLRYHHNTMCVRCAEAKCRFADTGRKVSVNPSETFFIPSTAAMKKVASPTSRTAGAAQGRT